MRKAFAGGWVVALGMLLTVSVAAPASAADPGYRDPRAYQQTVPPDVLNAPETTAAERAAWLDITRNYNQTAPGTKKAATVPVASKKAAAWTKVGTAVSVATFLPLIGAVGDFVTGGFFESQAGKNCETPGAFGAVTQFAGTLMGYGCEIPKDEMLEVPPGVLLDPWPPATPTATGFPHTNGTIAVQQPFWSTYRTLQNGNPSSTGTYVEGWVYPVSISGTQPVYFGRTDKNGAQVMEATNASGARSLHGSFNSACAAPVLCIAPARVGTSASDSSIMGTIKPYGGSDSTVPSPLPAGQDPYRSRLISAGGGTATPPAPTTGSTELTTTFTDTQGRTATCKTAVFDQNSGVIPQPCSPILPPDWDITANQTITAQPAGRPLEATPIQDVDTSPGYQDWMQSYPKCATEVCLLELDSTQYGSCFDAGEACADWYTDPNKTEKYNCSYAGAPLALEQCADYQKLFKPGAIAAGTAYPSTQDGTITNGQTSAVPRSNEGPKLLPDPETQADCFPTGWAVLNPAEWVLKPIKCGMTWAFVPRKTQVDATSKRIETSVNGSILGTAGIILASMKDVGLSEGCSGIPFTFDMYSVHVEHRILGACAGSALAPAAAIVKGVAVPALWTIAALAWVRYIANIVGYAAFGKEMSAANAAAEKAAKKAG